MSGTVTLTFFGDGDSSCSGTAIGTCGNIDQLANSGLTAANTWFNTTSEDPDTVQSGFFCNPDGTVNYYASLTTETSVQFDYGTGGPGVATAMNQPSTTCFDATNDLQPPNQGGPQYYFTITCDGSPGPEPDPSPASPSSSSGLSDGEIAAIVTGSIVAAILIYVLYIKFFSNT